MGTVIFQAIGITAGYGRRVVFSDLSLELAEGSCTFIIGANGCGKSTLFSVLSGIKRMRGGEILIDGLRAEAKQFRRQIGYVPQDNPLFTELSVKDNLLLWYGGREALQKEISGGVVEKLGLREVLKKRVSTLSGGMQRRVCIGCAMAGHPRILIMDEPGAALDLECKEILYGYLDEYRKAGGTVLMSSHEKSEWEMGDRIYLLRDGRLEDFRATDQTGYGRI